MTTGRSRPAHRRDLAPRRWHVDRALAAVGVLLGLTVLAVSTWTATSAAFSANSQTPGNSFTAGTVSLTDNGGGTSILVLGAARPTSTLTRCINVTYTGSLTAADLRLYSGSYQSPDAGTDPDGLAPYVTLVVERRPGSATSTCSNFAGGTGTTVFSGDASVFGASNGTYATGVGSFTPTPGAVYAYRVTTTVRDDPAAQATTMSIGLVWEVRR